MGVACATFLSSWPGVLRQLRCVKLHNDLSEYDEIHGCKTPKHVARVSLDDIYIWNLCLERGNALGEYASQALKVSDAAQPKGCSAHFVPMMAINKPDFLADIENNRHFTLALYRFFSKAGRVKAVNFFQDGTRCVKCIPLSFKHLRDVRAANREHAHLTNR